MAKSRADIQKAYRQRKAVSREQNLVADHAEGQTLVDLIAEVTRLAEVINAEMVADLKSRPLTREAARKLDTLEGKFTTIRIANIGLI